jgi:uncharacterized protein (TIGR02246 family)
MRRLTAVASLLLAAIVLPACTQPATNAHPDTRVADEAAIRAASTAWQEAGKAKDAARFTSFFAPDGVLMFHGMPPVTGKEAIDAMSADMLKDPAFALSWIITDIDVARSGDIAYERGTWQLTATDPATTKPVATRGEYVTIWKKQADGSWKVAFDIPVDTGGIGGG